MIRFRVIAMAAIVAGAGLTAAAAGPATASPATDTIRVSGAGSQPSAVGLLYVSVFASSDVTSITAHIRKSATAPDSFTATNFGDIGAKSGGAFTVTAPIPWGSGPGQLPLGSYDVYVDAKDQAGTSVSDAFAGYFNFLVLPTLTLSASPTSVDYNHRDVTFSGQLTGLYPDGSTVRPIPGKTISFFSGPYVGWGEQFTTSTDGAGNYVVAHEVTSGQYSAFLSGSDPTIYTGDATAGPVPLTVTPDPVRIQASLALPDVNYGEQDSVSGTIMYQSGSSWQPLPDTFLTVLESSPTGPSVQTATDGSGYFSLPLPAQTATGTWTVQAGQTPFFVTATSDLHLIVNLPIEIRKLSLRLSSSGTLHAAGCIAFTDPADQHTMSKLPIRVEYSPHRGGGPWRLLGKIYPSVHGRAYCPSVAASWVRSFTVRSPDAWYRARVAAVPGTQGAVSRSVHLRKS
jgi:hypothetical protein